MTTSELKPQSIWYSFNDVYRHVKIIFTKLEQRHTKKIMVVLGRGGWVAGRVLASFYEAAKKDLPIFTIIPTYINRNSSQETISLLQDLDEVSIKSIKQLIQKGYELCVFDAPFVTGGTMRFAKEHLRQIFQVEPLCVVLHWVEFQTISSATWRKPPDFTPDIFARKIQSDGASWYVQYPWEWNNLAEYDLNIKTAKSTR
jgi:hypoxanthine phosphoribosyltransferase